jgi:hypothetical protein
LFALTVDADYRAFYGGSSGSGGGDMTKAVYDPEAKEEQVLTVTDEAGYVLRDGTTPLTADWPAGLFRITTGDITLTDGVDDVIIDNVAGDLDVTSEGYDFWFRGPGNASIATFNFLTSGQNSHLHLYNSAGAIGEFRSGLSGFTINSALGGDLALQSSGLDDLSAFKNITVPYDPIFRIWGWDAPAATKHSFNLRFEDGFGYMSPSGVGIHTETVFSSQSLDIKQTDTISPPALAAHQNNYSPSGLSTCRIVRVLTTGANYNITGIDAITDRVLIFINVGTGIGTGNIVFKFDDSNSLAANRILLPSGADATLQRYDSLTFRYDSAFSRWTVIGISN